MPNAPAHLVSLLRRFDDGDLYAFSSIPGDCNLKAKAPAPENTPANGNGNKAVKSHGAISLASTARHLLNTQHVFSISKIFLPPSGRSPECRCNWRFRVRRPKRCKADSESKRAACYYGHPRQWAVFHSAVWCLENRAFENKATRS